jgi:hypothetical protein
MVDKYTENQLVLGNHNVFTQTSGHFPIKGTGIPQII